MFRFIMVGFVAAAVLGSATCGFAGPEIAIAGGLHLIPNGTGEGRVFASTELPDTLINTTNDVKLRIYNQGDQALTISLPINLSGFQSTNFTVTQNPATSIAPGDSSPLTINYHPTTIGAHEAVVTILNNDADEGNYLFIIQGNCLNSVLYHQPDISVHMVTPPVLKCNSKGLCSFSGTLAITNASNLPFLGGTWYISRLSEDGFSGHSSESIASGVIKKLKPWGGDPNFPATKTFKFKMKSLTPGDDKFALLVVPTGAGYDPDYTNNWILLDGI